jgi:hypothetical protein
MNTKEILSSYLASIGKKGGSIKSPAKAAASVENGKKGGRPKGGTKFIVCGESGMYEYEWFVEEVDTSVDEKVLCESRKWNYQKTFMTKKAAQREVVRLMVIEKLDP